MTKIKTTKNKSTFNNLYQINVNEHTEKKGGLTYLTWSWAWAKVKEIHPTASYTYYKHPETNLPFSFQENVGAFCHTSVTINDETLEMWLPVMGNRNEAILEPTSTQINKTLMRCLVKNIAMFGLGLYIYEGEDLPEITEDVIKESNETKADKIDYDKLNKKDKQAPNQLNWNLLILIPFYGFLGGLLCYLYFDKIGEVNKIIYFHIGLSSPLILRSLATSIPKIIN